jgi:hypothetical protein
MNAAAEANANEDSTGTGFFMDKSSSRTLI